MSDSLFRKSSLDKASSPEQLSYYIRVANPLLWVVLLAIIALLAGLLIWCSFATVHTSLFMEGVAKDGLVTCYLSSESESIDDVGVGQAVEVDDLDGKVKSFSDVPQSQREAASSYDDYTIYELDLHEWNYVIVAEVPGVENGVVDVRIITGVSHPLSFLVG